MSAVDLAVARLKTEEGFRAYAYTDSQGHLTIGYGFQIAAGLTRYAAFALLNAQAQERYKAIMEYPWAEGLDDVRASVMLDVSFNTGVSGLLHFVKMLAAIQDKNWKLAHDELLNSKAAKQDKERYEALAKIMRDGIV